MDPFTQGALGAAFSQSFADKKKIPVACLAGILGGMAPDLDILITSATDPLLGIEFHRHFTHSIWFIPIGGLLVAAAMWLVFNKLFKIRSWDFKTLYIFTTLGYATHATLDACTSYGTRLFWPLSNARVAWDAVAVIDPLPTLALFIFAVLSYRKRSATLARVGMACLIGYLSLGFLQNQRVKTAIEQVAAMRGHEVERIKLNPTLGNLIVWRATYEFNGRYYVDGVIAQPFAPPTVLTGSTVATIDHEAIYPQIGENSTQREDIRRFNYFAEGYLFEYQGTIADLRYSAEPHKIQPIWGIRIHPDTPDAHVDYLGYTRPNGRALNVTWSMLMGTYEPTQQEMAP
jgi:inner membrane protein